MNTFRIFLKQQNLQNSNTLTLCHFLLNFPSNQVNSNAQVKQPKKNDAHKEYLNLITLSWASEKFKNVVSRTGS